MMAMTRGLQVTVVCTFLLMNIALSSIGSTPAKSTSNEILTFILKFIPSTIEQLETGKSTSVRAFYHNLKEKDGVDQEITLHVSVEDDSIARLDNEYVQLNHVDLAAMNKTDENQTSSGNFTVRGLFLGYTSLFFRTCTNVTGRCDRNRMLNEDAGGWTKLETELRISVIRKRRVVDDVFTGVVTVLVIIANVGMGCKLKLDVVKESLKRPVAPVIGFLSQFCFMPPLAFGLGRALSLTPSQAMGLFTIGCSPGGGASNIYTYLLRGDLSLSVTMTLVSIIASFGMIPLWMFTLGKLPIRRLGMGSVEIPYSNIVISLVGIIVPVTIGIVIKRKSPKAAKVISKILRPVLVVFLIFMFTFGIWVNFYMFQLFTPRLIAAGLILPVAGFLCGGLLATACRRPRKQIIAISLETGIQNTGVAIILLLYSLPAPDSDLSFVGAIAVTTFTPVAPLTAIAIHGLVRRFCRKETGEDTSDESEKAPESDNIAAEFDEEIVVQQSEKKSIANEVRNRCVDITSARGEGPLLNAHLQCETHV